MENSTKKEFYTFTEQNGVLAAAVTKRVSVSEFSDLMVDMRAEGLKRNISKLLIDLSTVDFRDLALSERHDFGLAGAQIFNGSFRVACLAQAQFINKHGENVANNRGGDVLVTDNEEEAYNWLWRKDRQPR